ncbi:MAG: aldehyde dehydrogenase family protein, partial [Spirochaetes bacterium]|nr:aldehyde dehydrogenase family protein [Spirochaetota bacterium]
MAKIINPATGGTITEAVYDSSETLIEAVNKARAAQRKWRNLKPKERNRRLSKIRSVIVKHTDELASTISSVTGKSKVDAIATEILPAVIAARYYPKLAKRVLRPEKIRRSSIFFFNKKAYVYHEPYGVIGIISPWNYPFIIPFHEIMMALTTGNTVILKVATQSQPVGKLIQTIFDEADLPADILRVVNLPGEITGKAFIDAGIDKILFTGSTETGHKIAGLAGKNLVPVSFELGGSDAMIVLPDANLKRAVNGALWAGLSNSGQSCGGVERIYAADSVYDKFKELLVENAKKIRIGSPDGSGTEIGPLTTEQQKKKVSGHVEDAVRRGASVIYRSGIPAGVNGSGFFYPVTILENVPADAPVMQEETFGPVLVLERVRDESEIIRKANDSPMGLTSSLWTSSRKKAADLPRLLETGVVSVNDHLMSHGMPETPWGGYKDSGHSRTHGKWG